MMIVLAWAWIAFVCGFLVGAWWGHRLGVVVTELRWVEAVRRKEDDDARGGHTQ